MSQVIMARNISNLKKIQTVSLFIPAVHWLTNELIYTDNLLISLRLL